MFKVMCPDNKMRDFDDIEVVQYGRYYDVDGVLGTVRITLREKLKFEDALRELLGLKKEADANEAW